MGEDRGKTCCSTRKLEESGARVGAGKGPQEKEKFCCYYGDKARVGMLYHIYPPRKFHMSQTFHIKKKRNHGKIDAILIITEREMEKSI